MNNSCHIGGSGPAVFVARPSVPGGRHQRIDLKKTLAKIVEHLLRALVLVFSLCKAMATTDSPDRQGQLVQSYENRVRVCQGGEGSVNGEEEDLAPSDTELGYPVLPCVAEERCVLAAVLLLCKRPTQPPVPVSYSLYTLVFRVPTGSICAVHGIDLKPT